MDQVSFTCKIFFRCPDPQNPSTVLYDHETDRLIPFSDTYESIDTDCGPVSISGMLLNLYIKALRVKAFRKEYKLYFFIFYT